MVLKATADDRRHLTLCHDEFRGSRSGLCRSEGRFMPIHYLAPSCYSDADCGAVGSGSVVRKVRHKWHAGYIEISDKL
ncbi:hypothetical protein TNCV_4274081 [Trichonephila clavipes]|nr:hypothetical protein TNCV_4274081 [Trichonephila clavipes]